MLDVTRRDMLTAGAGGALIGFGAPALAAPAPDSLAGIAAARGLRFGSAVGWSPPGVTDRGSFANPAYAALLERECALLVPENVLKWQWLRPSPTAFNFAAADATLAWAEAHGLAMRGHNLLWHQPKWFPAWLNTYSFGAQPRVEAERLLTAHVTTVLRRYGERIRGYDVVNEAVRPADGVLYDTSLSRAMGGPEPTLDLAFHAARAAAPHAQLVYNDYMSWEPGNAHHRAGASAAAARPWMRSASSRTSSRRRPTRHRRARRSRASGAASSMR